VLFLYGTGLAFGLHLALAGFALFGSVLGSLFTMAATMAYCTLVLALWIWVLPRFTQRPFATRLAWQTMVSVAFITLLSFIVGELFSLAADRPSLLYPNAGQSVLTTLTSEQLRHAPMLGVLIPIIPTSVLCVVSFNLYWLRINALHDRERALRELTTSAQLAALRAQLNPHFLFNSLNSIAQLITADPEKAEQCVERLAAIFRYMLARQQAEFVPLDDELKVAEAYLDIERARFGDHLTVEQHVDNEARPVHVPGFVLQPLVENAVRHGISQKIGGGSVTIQASLKNDNLELSVEDTGGGIIDVETIYERGVGLRNVRERLIRLFGEAYEPRVVSTLGRGTRITVRVPIGIEQRSEAA